MPAKSLILATLLLTLASTAGCGPSPPTIRERAGWVGHSGEVVALAFSPDGKSLASRSADAVKVWEIAGGHESRSFPADGAPFGSVAFSPDGKIVASERVGIGVIAWDLTSGGERVYPGKEQAKSNDSATNGWGVACSPNGKTWVGGGSHGGVDGFLTFWDAATGDRVESAPIRRPITTVVFSPDGKTIASGSMDGKLGLWDSATHRERLSIAANRSYLAPVVFSPDGRVVASAEGSRWVRFWDVANGREVATFKGHLKAILSLAFHPDGRTLVSGDSGGIIIVWDVASREMIARIDSKAGKVWALAFSPDGKVLASAGEDWTIHFRELAQPEGGR